SMIYRIRRKSAMKTFLFDRDCKTLRFHKLPSVVRWSKFARFGPILEKASFLGFGWIGVETEKLSTENANINHVAGNFETYLHTGPYKTLGNAYKKIMKGKR